MKFIADLHIHSKYSIATAKNLDLENLYVAARMKGITLVGTGDFTHPAWFDEIRRKLVPAEPGLYRLNEKSAAACESQLPASCPGQVRFVLTAEISNIYKKAGRTRKNHNLILLADLNDALRLNQRLERVGNIHSDGRPILGLDARDLLEMVLEVDERSMFIPAHIWTPWFSLLGSKSGFDTVEACFEELTPHIFALETGLSSDPAMNWRVSNLDRYTLVSNSDAHSPLKLGREANRFDTELSFGGIYNALKSGDMESFEGTFEFFPQEGKYHLDGHSKCGLCLTPGETNGLGGICPHCEKPLTLGVLNRVEALADQRPSARKGARHPYLSIVPLLEILSEIYGVGVNTKTVRRAYHRAITRLGDEFSILSKLSGDQIARAGIPLLAEAVRRMRTGAVHIDAGYDGRFGTVRLFETAERQKLAGQWRLLLSLPPETNSTSKAKKITQSALYRAPAPSVTAEPTVQSAVDPPPQALPLNPYQKAVVEHDDSAMIVVAGPGTGKTHTITTRMVRLINDADVDPEQILALTFTNKAAGEMRQRVAEMTEKASRQPVIVTFHGLCNQLLKAESAGDERVLLDTENRTAMLRDAVDMVAPGGQPVAPWNEAADQAIMRAKQRIEARVQADDLAGIDGIDLATVNHIYEAYTSLMRLQGVQDFEDLIIRVVRRLEGDSGYRLRLQQRFRYIFVDEYQDLNEGQYRLLRSLVPADGRGLCVIGDPDQAIYGFRGSDQRFFLKFTRDYPAANVVELQRNYRSTPAILKAARQILNGVGTHHGSRDRDLTGFAIQPAALFSKIEGRATIGIITAKTDHEEARAIARMIEERVGGRGFHDIDTGWITQDTAAQRSYGDFAVLFRTHSQSQRLSQALGDAGIPFCVAAREALFQQAGIGDLLALAKLVNGGGLYSDLASAATLMEGPPSGLALKRLKRWGLMRETPVWRALDEVRHLPISGMSRNQQAAVVRLAQWLERIKNGIPGGSAETQLRWIMKHTGRVEWLAADRQLAHHWELIFELAKDRSWEDFITRISLYQDSDRYSEVAQQVTLMSMHAAKGLEFAVVIVAGCEDGLIPYRPREEKLSDRDLAEEARLFYVAMTRAQSELYLSYAQQRHRFGQRVTCRRSTFLDMIETHLMARETARAPRKKRRYHQQQLF